MEDEQYVAIYDYLEHETYPAGLTKSQKFVLRRSCKNYKLFKGKLFYKNQNSDGTDRDRLVVKKMRQTEFFLSVTLQQEDTEVEMLP